MMNCPSLESNPSIHPSIAIVKKILSPLAAIVYLIAIVVLNEDSYDCLQLYPVESSETPKNKKII